MRLGRTIHYLGIAIQYKYTGSYEMAKLIKMAGYTTDEIVENMMNVLEETMPEYTDWYFGWHWRNDPKKGILYFGLPHDIMYSLFADYEAFESFWKKIIQKALPKLDFTKKELEYWHPPIVSFEDTEWEED